MEDRIIRFVAQGEEQCWSFLHLSCWFEAASLYCNPYHGNEQTQYSGGSTFLEDDNTLMLDNC